MDMNLSEVLFRGKAARCIRIIGISQICISWYAYCNSLR